MRLLWTLALLAFPLAVSAQPVLASGATVADALGPGDDALASGEWADEFVVEASARPFEVAVAAEGFAPFLLFVSPEGEVLRAEPDPQLPDEIAARLEGGPWRIVVTSERPGESGRYRLSHLPVLLETDAIEGALAAGDAALASGEWSDRFIVEDTGQPGEVRLTASGFRPYLLIDAAGAAQGEVRALTGRPEVASARLAPGTGPWIVHVTTEAPGEAGAYRLVRRPVPEPRALVMGGAAEGVLTDSSEWMDDGSSADRYTLEASGAPFEVRLRSLAFDAFLMLEAPSGARYTNDDRLGDAAEAAVAIGPPEAEPGTWTIWATTFAPRDHGPYRIEAHPVTAPEAARQRALDDSLAALAPLWEAYETALSDGDYGLAAGVAQQAAERTRRLGRDLPALAAALNRAAIALSYDDPSDAEPLYGEARDLALRLVGPQHPLVAEIEGNLGDLYRETARFDAARAAFTRQRDLFRQMRPADHPDLAVAETNLGVLALNLGETARAVGHLEAAVAGLDARGGGDSTRLAMVLTNLGAALTDLGAYDRAEAALGRASDLRQRLGDHPDAWFTFAALGVLDVRLGRYEAARERLEAAHRIAAATHGPASWQAALALANLGSLAQSRGDLVGARAFFERSLRAYEASRPADHPDIANASVTLAGLLYSLGDAEAARPHAERALALRERAFGPAHVRVIEAQNMLAITLFSLGEGDAARGLLGRAVRIGLDSLGAANPVVAVAAANLARLAMLGGDAASGDEVLTTVLEAQTAVLPADHPEIAHTRLTRAAARMLAGDLAGAYDDAERARSALAASVGEVHPMTIHATADLALYAVLGGDIEAGGVLALDAGRAATQFAETVLPSLASAEQAVFTQQTLPSLTSAVLTAWARGARGTPSAETYGVIGGWKGLLLRGLRQQADASALADDPEHGPAVSRLLALRAALAQAVQTGIGVDSLARDKEAAERAVAAALPTLDDPWRLGASGGLQRALPADAAFVDVYRYQHLGGERDGWRYAAVVVTPRQPPRLLDLGLADAADAEAGRWRQRRDQPDAGLEPLAARVWAPIQAALPMGTQRVWVAPDGALVRLPWDVLARAHASDAPLVAQAPSARALLTLLTSAPEPLAPEALVVGGVDFGAAPEGEAALWQPLSGATREADTVAALAAEAGLTPRPLSDSAATPAAVARLASGAGYLHLATHGYFGGTTEAAYADRGARGPDAEVGAAGPGQRLGRNPLAESGLALAGANAGASGLLSAEEMVGLDLRGARLVVLSACDTGRGAEVTGQGVLGLQAAVQAAGARALLMSLWPVDDDATAALMSAFYRGLWRDGLGPAEALRQAQAAVRAEARWRAPAFWAGWSLVGDAF